MKLYNKTKCPDEILKPLLVAAGKSVGARTANVVVKVTQGQYGHSCKGMSYNHFAVYTWHLWGRKKKERKYRKGSIRTDSGWFEITLPGNLHTCFVNAEFDKEKGIVVGEVNHIGHAENFYKTAQHEWGHIKDYQDGTYTRTPRTSSGRRIAWTDRPCEQAAMNRVEDAKKIKGIDDLILNLAIYFESCARG